MPKYYFNEEDLFHNIIRTYPKFALQYYFNNAYINNQIAQGANLPNGFISYFETAHSGSTFTPFITTGENSYKLYPYNSNILGAKNYPLLSGVDITGSYPITSSISRGIIISGAAGVTYVAGVASESTVFAVKSLFNAYNSYAPQAANFNFSKYIMALGGKERKNGDGSIHSASMVNPQTTLIEIPRLFRGDRIKKGSVKLRFYFTGSLIGEASDIQENGLLVETVGPSGSAIIGTVLYREGYILITASYNLNNEVIDGYLSPASGTFADPTTPGGLQTSWQAHPAWVHFGAYQSFITASNDSLYVLSSSFAPTSSSYTLDFKGTNTSPTLLMMCHAQKNDLNWSNNPTFIDRRNEFTASNYQNIYILNTGSKGYAENRDLVIKNTISSSFCDYSESYKPQTFISKIGIYDDDGDLIGMAKLANPVRKTNEQDYTFKLKLDL
jgi:hypothetical protein